MTDLSSITPKLRSINILNPATGLPAGLTIRLFWPSHPRVKDARQQLAVEQAQAARRREMPTAQKKEEADITLLAAAVEGWEWANDADWGGEKLECTDVNVRKVLKSGWLRQQVDTELGDESAFFR